MEPPAVATSDQEWMLRLQRGEAEAFNVLVMKYQGPVAQFLGRMVREPALAEELAQEVFLRVYRARKTWRPRAKFSTWLFHVATNVGLNALRDGRQRRLRETPLEGGEEEGAGPALRLADRGLNAEQAMLENERREQIRRAVEALPEKQRLAVLLHKYQELDYAEIAEILGCSESALKSLLFRAYESLRVTLKPMLGARV